jgi:hypothetical protein
MTLCQNQSISTNLDGLDRVHSTANDHSAFQKLTATPPGRTFSRTTSGQAFLRLSRCRMDRTLRRRSPVTDTASSARGAACMLFFLASWLTPLSQMRPYTFLSLYTPIVGRARSGADHANDGRPRAWITSVWGYSRAFLAITSGGMPTADLSTSQSGGCYRDHKRQESLLVLNRLDNKNPALYRRDRRRINEYSVLSRSRARIQAFDAEGSVESTRPRLWSAES